MNYDRSAKKPNCMSIRLEIPEADLFIAACESRISRRLARSDEPLLFDTVAVKLFKPNKVAVFVIDTVTFERMKETLEEHVAYIREEADVITRIGPDFPSMALQLMDEGDKTQVLADEFAGAILAHESGLHEDLEKFLVTNSSGDQTV